MLSWYESRKLPKLRFNDRVREAWCVGNGGYFSDDWHRRRDARDCEDGQAVHYKPLDYILVRWPGSPNSRSSLLYFHPDGEFEFIAECIGDGPYEIEDAVLGHGNPEGLERVRVQRAEQRARDAAKHARWLQRPLRADLASFVAGLAPGEVFRTPKGRIGRVAGIGKAWATYRWIDAAPEGVEVIDLLGEADEHRLCRYM